MQGRRSVVGSLPDTLGFDHGSTPNDVTGLDQQIRWSNMQNSSHNHLPEYSPSNASNRLMNSTTGVEQNLSGWNLDEPSPILDERQFAAPNNFSHSSASVNLSSNQILNGPLFPQSSISDSIHQDLNISSGFAGHNTYKSSSSQNARLPTSSTADPFLLPSGSNGYVVEENDAMRGCKRKAHEGNVGPSSSSPNYYHRAEPSLTGEPNQGLRLGVGGVSSASGESSRRNLRMRINPPHQQELPPVHTFSTGINSLNLRSPSPSPSPADNTSLHENLVRTPTQQHSQQSARWNRNFISSPSSSNVANPREESTLSSGVHPSSAAAPPNRIPHRNHPRYQRRLVEIIRRSLANSTGGEYVNSQGSGTPASMPEMSPSSVEQGHHLSQSRSAVPLNGQVDGAFGSMRSLPSSTGGRNRLMSEHIRNILDLMRRGEGLRFEDVMILDQAVFFGMANIHDQHRDMRLDVDNMSYEELLALEDRIGNVNTGLSEETILTRLKRRKCLTSTTTDQLEVEPCCICQEEYKCGEDLGMLECGHDFHSDCIKQWLKQKNLCPICKTTALIT